MWQQFKVLFIGWRCYRLSSFLRGHNRTFIQHQCDEEFFARLKRRQIRRHRKHPFDWPGRKVCFQPSLGSGG